MKRSQQLARMLRVQEQLRKLAEVRLATLDKRRAELQAAEARILDSMTSPDPRDWGLARIGGDRLRWIERDLQENEMLRRESAERWRDLAQRGIAIEKLQGRAEEDERRHEERKDLEEILACLQAHTASLS